MEQIESKWNIHNKIHDATQKKNTSIMNRNTFIERKTKRIACTHELSGQKRHVLLDVCNEATDRNRLKWFLMDSYDLCAVGDHLTLIIIAYQMPNYSRYFILLKMKNV